VCHFPVQRGREGFVADGIVTDGEWKSNCAERERFGGDSDARWSVVVELEDIVKLYSDSDGDGKRGIWDRRFSQHSN